MASISYWFITHFARVKVIKIDRVLSILTLCGGSFFLLQVLAASSQTQGQLVRVGQSKWQKFP